MNDAAFGALLIPILGLFAICRNGKWYWDPIYSTFQIKSRLLTGVFWLGWTAGLIVGMSEILDLLR